MIISGSFQSAKLDAIAQLVQEDVKEVKIFFNEKENSWCVESEVLTLEEWERENNET